MTRVSFILNKFVKCLFPSSILFYRGTDIRVDSAEDNARQIIYSARSNSMKYLGHVREIYEKGNYIIIAVIVLITSVLLLTTDGRGGVDISSRLFWCSHVSPALFHDRVPPFAQNISLTLEMFLIGLLLVSRYQLMCFSPIESYLCECQWHELCPDRGSQDEGCKAPGRKPGYMIYF